MDSVLVTVLLPVALAVIMFGLGLDLTIADFRRLLTHPRATFLCMGFQLVLMPLVCFGLVHLFGLAPALAVGMIMTIALSPALLDRAAMAVPAAVYGVLMFATATVAGFALRVGGSRPRERELAG